MRWIRAFFFILTLACVPVSVLAQSNVGTITRLGSTLQIVGSVAALNGIAIQVDTSGYRWVSIQVGNTFVGTLAIETSNTGVDWETTTVAAIGALSPTPGVVSATAPGMWQGPVNARYFRVKATDYVSGTADVTTLLFPTPSAWQLGSASGDGGSCSPITGFQLTTAGNPVMGTTAFDQSLAPLCVVAGADALASAGGELSSVAIGDHTLTADSSGTLNTAVGFQAGTGVTTGGHNTILGAEVGQALTTGSGNIYLGNSTATNAGSGAESDTLRIGTLLVGDLSGTHLGIGGTPSANAALDASSQTSALKLPSGTTAQRPTAENSMIRYNSDIPGVEARVNGSWTTLGAAGVPTGTVNTGTAGQLAYYGGTGTAVDGNVNANISNGSLTLGVANTTIGKVLLKGNTSGTVTLAPQAAAGTPVVTWGTNTGTPVVTGSSPLVVTSATGDASCPTCATTTNGGDLTGTAPVAVSAAGAISLSGTAGQVPNGLTGAFTATPTLGIAGASIGTLTFAGNSSGSVLLKPQAAAGTPTVTFGTASGTPAVTASSPLAITSATGNMTCATCVTSSGGGAITGTAPVAVSAAGAVSLSGGAGQVPNGATGAFTATPTLGASGTLGSLTMGNATSGTVTVAPVAGALGTVTWSLPAATDTAVGKATTDVFTNKTFDTADTGNVLKINTTAVTDKTGTGKVVLDTTPTLVTPVLGAATGTTLALGANGGSIGQLTMNGNTSGTVTVKPQAAAGTPTVTWGTSSGTPAVTVSAPLALSTATGNLTVTGAAGQVLAGATPAFTATPTLGASGTLGSLTMGNATSGTITVAPVTGALGTPTLSLPAATDTLVGKATTDTLTNKTFDTAGSGNVFKINTVTVSDKTGTGKMVLDTSPTLVTPVLGVASGTSLALGASGTLGSMSMGNATSGVVTVQPVAGALGTVTWSIPAATDTAVGKATTDTLTNKTYDTAGSGNVFKINGTAISDITGTGKAVLDTTPILTTPVLGVAAATSINKVAITPPATSATLTIADGKTLTASNTLTFTGTDTSTVAFGAGGTVAYTGNKLSVFAATTSAELAGVLSDETGSGTAVFNTSPTLVTPTLGVASATTVNTTGTGTTCQYQLGGVCALWEDGATNQNTVVGNSGAPATISGGTGNTYIGYHAGNATIGGGSNVAIGTNADALVTSGGDNVAMGNGALHTVVSGNDNTAIGDGVLGLHTGSNATGLGSAALQVATGAGNTALGRKAGLIVTTGANNLLIGPNVASTVLTTGSNNIEMGVSAAITTASLSTSDTINIGGTGGSWVLVTGTGTNTTANTIMHGILQLPDLSTNTGATTGTVCWTTSTGNLRVNNSTACTASLEEWKNIKWSHAMNGLDIVMKLKPFWFTWKKKEIAAGDKYEQPGLGAHHTESVDKRLVGYGTDGKLQGVRYQELTAVLVKAIQEQQAQIDELKRQLARRS